MRLPDKFVENMNNLLGREANKFFESLKEDSIKALTLDTNKMSKQDFEKESDIDVSAIDYIENGYYYIGKIGDTFTHHAGVVYSQDASAMLPVVALGVEENDIVLDMCSAPGGKSIQILEKLNNTGLLISNEYVYSRAKILYENLVRFGYRNYIITNNMPSDFVKKIEVFDKILIDAPCSGEGMFRKSDIDTYSWNEKNVTTCAYRQLEILESASRLLREGGKMMYSTCTYNITENEGVVVEFLRNHPEYIICDLPKEIKDNTARGILIDDKYDTTKAGRRYPHLHKGEGQFMVLLKKIGDGDINYCNNTKLDKYIPLGRKDKQLLDKYVSDIVDIKEMNLYRKGDNIYVAPDVNFDYTGLNVVTVGVCMGTMSSKDMKLNHAFYRAYGDKFYNKVELEEDSVNKYLSGNVVEGLEDKKNGIVSVMYKGLPLGGGKIVNGTLKNYYKARSN